jgi:hypothetical protein
MVAREMRPRTRRSGSIAAAHSTEAVRAQGPGAPTDSRTGRCGCRVPAGGKWLWGSPARCCSAVASAFRRRTLLAHATTDAEASLGVRWRRGTTRWHDRRVVQRVTLMPRSALSAEVGLAASLVAEATPLASRCFGCGCRAVSVLDVVDGRIFGKPSGWRPDGGEGILRPSTLEDAGDHHVDRPVGGLDLPVVPLIQVMGNVPGEQLREIPHLGISERSASVGCHPNRMSAVSRRRH